MTSSSTRSSTPASIKSLGGLAARDTAKAGVKGVAAKGVKKTPVDKFHETRLAESHRVTEKNRMAHEAKMARLANKKFKYEKASNQAAQQAQLEMMKMQIQLETIRGQNLAAQTLQAAGPSYAGVGGEFDEFSGSSASSVAYSSPSPFLDMSMGFQN